MPHTNSNFICLNEMELIPIEFETKVHNTKRQVYHTIGPTNCAKGLVNGTKGSIYCIKGPVHRTKELV